MTEIVTQLSIHMENRPGALAELTQAFVDAGVNLLAISVPDTGEFGTVRIVPDDALEARSALESGGYPHAAVSVLAVELPHRTGALAEVARLLAEENVVVRYAYATIVAGGNRGLCVLNVDDINKAKEVLSTKLTP